MFKIAHIDVARVVWPHSQHRASAADQIADDGRGVEIGGAPGHGVSHFGLVQRDGILVILGLIIGIAWISLLLVGGLALIKYLLGLIGIGSGGTEDAEIALIFLQNLPI